MTSFSQRQSITRMRLSLLYLPLYILRAVWYKAIFNGDYVCFLTASNFGRLCSLFIPSAVWYKIKKYQSFGGNCFADSRTAKSSLLLCLFLSYYSITSDKTGQFIYFLNLVRDGVWLNSKKCQPLPIELYSKDKFHILKFDERSLWMITNNLDVSSFSKWTT